MHLAVVVMVPACLFAGWWQATRALGGNGLSWAYTVEWPGFALIAVAGWWHLIHEDPEAYQARRARANGDATVEVGGVVDPPGPGLGQPVAPGDGAAARWSTTPTAEARWSTTTALVMVGAELLLGVVTVLAVPVGRPAGWLPSQGRALYLVHALFGVALTIVALALVVRSREAPRTARVVAWLGLSGVAIAGAGGLLTDARSLVRFLGLVLMFVGTVVAAFGYGGSLLLRSSPSGSQVSAG